MTGWAVWIVLTLLALYIVSETMGSKLKEGFAVPRRADIGPTSEGWTHDEAGYVRDLRYTESFVDVQGHGVAADFCRAIHKKGDPASLHIACALATREGMNTMEYFSPMQKEGFRFSRDDYWRDVNGDGRMDYCRILKDAGTGEWYSSCALATKTGLGSCDPRKELRDTSPPPKIQDLLEAYTGAMTWFRWQDDGLDYAENAVMDVRGNTHVPDFIKPEKTRGLQLNRWPQASQDAGEAAPPLRDYVLWGEKGTLQLDQAVKPTEVRAIAFWVWWDHFEKGARILESSNGGSTLTAGQGGGKKDLVWIGVDSFGMSKELKPASPLQIVASAQEVSAQQVFALGPPQTEPVKVMRHQEPMPTSGTANLVFEIWDAEQRIMRLQAPQGAKTGQWQHVVFTTTDSASWWPTWQVWIDGKKIAEKEEGRTIPALLLAQNVIGKDFRGCLQDFRIYNRPMTATDITDAMAWGQKKLHPLP